MQTKLPRPSHETAARESSTPEASEKQSTEAREHVPPVDPELGHHLNQVPARAPSQGPGGSGSTLPAPLRQTMESALGHDFSDVRIHQSQQVSALDARALTRGTNIHFAPGQYQPESSQGRELIGHELTHVVQQRTGKVRPPSGAGAPIVDSPAHEAEADAAGRRAAGMAARPASAPAPGPSGGQYLSFTDLSARPAGPSQPTSAPRSRPPAAPGLSPVAPPSASAPIQLKKTAGASSGSRTITVEEEDEDAPPPLPPFHVLKYGQPVQLPAPQPQPQPANVFASQGHVLGGTTHLTPEQMREQRLRRLGGAMGVQPQAAPPIQEQPAEQPAAIVAPPQEQPPPSLLLKSPEALRTASPDPDPGPPSGSQTIEEHEAKPPAPPDREPQRRAAEAAIRRQNFAEAKARLAAAAPNLLAKWQQKKNFADAKAKLAAAAPNLLAKWQQKNRFAEAKAKLAAAAPNLLAKWQQKNRFAEAKAKLAAAAPNLLAKWQQKNRFAEAKAKLAAAYPAIAKHHMGKAKQHGLHKALINEIKNARTMTKIAHDHLQKNPVWMDPYGLKWNQTPWGGPGNMDRVEHVLHHNVDDPLRKQPHGVFNDPGNPATHNIGGSHPDVVALAHRVARDLTLKPGKQARKFTGEELLAVNKVAANGGIPDFTGWNVIHKPGKNDAYDLQPPAPVRTGTLGGKPGAKKGHPALQGGYRQVINNPGVNDDLITFFPI